MRAGYVGSEEIAEDGGNISNGKACSSMELLFEVFRVDGVAHLGDWDFLHHCAFIKEMKCFVMDG